ncbi:hypothetical protein DYB26_013824, partial [Aphanomyces astaci]
MQGLASIAEIEDVSGRRTIEGQQCRTKQRHTFWSMMEKELTEASVVEARAVRIRERRMDRMRCKHEMQSRQADELRGVRNLLHCQEARIAREREEGVAMATADADMRRHWKAMALFDAKIQSDQMKRSVALLKQTMRLQLDEHDKMNAESKLMHEAETTERLAMDIAMAKTMSITKGHIVVHVACRLDEATSSLPVAGIQVLFRVTSMLASHMNTALVHRVRNAYDMRRGLWARLAEEVPWRKAETNHAVAYREMKSHIATDCPGEVPVKLRSLGIVAEGLGPPIKRRKRDKDGEDGSSKTHLDGSGGVMSPLGLTSAIMMHHRDALKHGMAHHHVKGKGNGAMGSMGQSDPLEKILMVKAFVCNNIPIDIADNKHFRDWLRGINSSYKPVSGDDLRTLVVQQYAAEMAKLKDVVASGFHRITLTPSGRRDASNQRIIHINLTNQNRVSIIWSIVSFPNDDESLQRLGNHVLTPVLMEVSPERFIGVCTDDDADLLQAADEVAAAYPWILPVRCMAQLTNYLLREWMKIPDINHVFMVAGSILSYFRQSPDVMLLLHDTAAQMNVHRCRLLQFSATNLSDCILS